MALILFVPYCCILLFASAYLLTVIIEQFLRVEKNASQLLSWYHHCYKINWFSVWNAALPNSQYCFSLVQVASFVFCLVLAVLGN